MLICTFPSCAPYPGKTNNATIDLGESTKFSEDEIQQAVDCVLEKFPDFKGCDLQKLWYNEQESNKEYGTDNILGIVLLSNFHVGAVNAGNSSFNPNSDYLDWKWLLVRNSETSKWTLKSWGYA